MEYSYNNAGSSAASRLSVVWARSVCPCLLLHFELDIITLLWAHHRCMLFNQILAVTQNCRDTCPQKTASLKSALEHILCCKSPLLQRWSQCGGELTCDLQGISPVIVSHFFIGPWITHVVFWQFKGAICKNFSWKHCIFFNEIIILGHLCIVSQRYLLKLAC